MTSFKFPPPPPPPPKATANDAQDPYLSQRGGGGGRGGRGRGTQGRGRGHNSRGGSRGGFAHNANHLNGNGQARGGSRGGHSHGKDGSHQNTPTHPPPQPNVTTMEQAMSFMSTPAGAQSMAAFSQHMAQIGQPSVTPPGSNQAQSHNNNKRKRDEQHGNGTGSQAQSSPKPKPPRQFAKAPPAVPGFGFIAPTPLKTPASPVSKSTKLQAPRNRKVQLGLIQQDTEHIESESETENSDIDEEAQYALLPASKRMVFEHEGQTVSLQTAAEVASWIKDRRKHFPTQERIQQRTKEEQERRGAELEFLSRVKGKKQRIKEPAKHPRKKPDKILDAARNAAKEKARAELESLRKKLHESMLAKKDAASVSDKTTLQTLDLGLGYGSDSDSGDDASSVLSDSSVLSSSEESADEVSEAHSDSEPDADDSDSDAPPEAQSSKAQPSALPIAPPPPRPAPIERALKRPSRGVCDAWKEKGACPRGDGCSFQHPRIGLYDRMIEQQLVKSDRLALDAIKWLGRNGFLG
ncbi:hypothetical protein B0J11DRAFT_530285 [Dendryphion nanum]|uniref:C3H1-type domain-containing protein n=1 Tax=Dendryphion nanum TaxID=256645 RepID=A0A9P9DRZ2_9PLEO|nr:hypothetical protein B0J11DRAFT_530285 [Dendryphion nanum]